MIGHYQCNDNAEAKNDDQIIYIKKMSSLNKILKFTKGINEKQKDMLFSELEILFQKQVFTISIWEILKKIHNHIDNEENR